MQLLLRSGRRGARSDRGVASPGEDGCPPQCGHALTPRRARLTAVCTGNDPVLCDVRSEIREEARPVHALRVMQRDGSAVTLGAVASVAMGGNGMSEPGAPGPGPERDTIGAGSVAAIGGVG